MSEKKWIVDWNWLAWVFGLVFGPEVAQVHIGPLTISYVLREPEWMSGL